MKEVEKYSDSKGDQTQYKMISLLPGRVEDVNVKMNATKCSTSPQKNEKSGAFCLLLHEMSKYIQIVHESQYFYHKAFVTYMDHLFSLSLFILLRDTISSVQAHAGPGNEYHIYADRY